MRILYLFLDGIGLGDEDSNTNPFVRFKTPTIESLLGGKKLANRELNINNENASLIALDASLGIDGIPQSASSQGVLLTGINIPKLMGYHYGPKPNNFIASIVTTGNLFSRCASIGKKSALLNAYPPKYFEAIKFGRRAYSTIPLAVVSAGIALRTQVQLITGQAISADFTGKGWHEYLGIQDIPLLTAYKAGEKISKLSLELDIAFFEFWLSDYAGHHQDMNEAKEVITLIDSVIAGIIDSWDYQEGLIVVTSDHGNLEDLSTRRHTLNPIPLLLIGTQQLREQFLSKIEIMPDIASSVIDFIR